MYEPINPQVYTTYDTRGEVNMVKPASPARTLPMKTLGVEPTGAEIIQQFHYNRHLFAKAQMEIRAFHAKADQMQARLRKL